MKYLFKTAITNYHTGLKQGKIFSIKALNLQKRKSFNHSPDKNSECIIIFRSYTMQVHKWVQRVRNLFGSQLIYVRMPSTASKLTFLLSTCFTGGTICYVHYKQVYDRAQLHRGIEIEEERLEGKRRLNLEQQKQQISIEKAYRGVADT